MKNTKITTDNIFQLQKTVDELTLQINILVGRVEVHSSEIIKLKEENTLLCEENKKLKDIIAKNSSNSSKPPSTDIGKKKKNNSRTHSGRKPGGQPGHSGSNLMQVEKPDKTEILIPVKCKCGYSFSGLEKTSNSEIRQVFDIPKPEIEVTEYISPVYECPCCCGKVKKEFPESVKSHVQYGSRLKGFAVYLMNYQLLPYKRTVDLFKDLYNIPLSQGTLNNILLDYSERLNISIELIKTNIISSDTVHFDESGFYSEGGRHWIHAAGTNSFTYYHYHESRGYEALKSAGILDYFKGTAVHDYWSAYYKYQDCSHSLCNAHHLRDLQGIYDSTKLEWSKDMKSLLSKMKIEVDNAKLENKTCLSTGICNNLVSKFNKLIQFGYQTTPLPKIKKKETRGKQKRGKALCLLDRFSNRSDEILDFIFDFSKPFDNNQAERDIRMTKVKQKISGTFRNSEMAKVFCRIRSFISTAIKQSVNVIQAILEIYDNKIFLLQ